MPTTYTNTEEGGITVTETLTAPEPNTLGTIQEFDVKVGDGILTEVNEDDEELLLRKKKPSDHSFFGDNVSYNVEDSNKVLSVGLGVQYFGREDCLFYFSIIGGEVARVDVPDVLSEDEGGDVSSAVTTLNTSTTPVTSASFSSINKAFVASQSDGDVYPIDLSGGGISEGAAISTGNTGGVTVLHSFPSAPLLVAVGAQEVTFIDPVSETVLSSTASTTSDLSSGFSEYNSYSESSSIDRGLASVDFGDGELFMLNGANEVAADVTSLLDSEVNRTCYVRDIDSYFVGQGARSAVLVDPTTLQKSDVTTISGMGVGDEIGSTGTRRTIEGRFIIQTSENDSGGTRVINPETFETLDNVPESGTLGSAYDRSRSYIWGINAGSNTIDYIEYNPYK